MNKVVYKKNKTLDLIYISIFAALIAVCTFLSIPLIIPFTMQTFAVFLSLLTLGGKRGTLSIVVYLSLGFIGLPVFSGFKSGIGALFSPTGGYLISFLFMGLIYLIITEYVSNQLIFKLIALIIGMTVCYLFGSLWFFKIYTQTNIDMTFFKVLSICVFPFVIPDLLKLLLAVSVSKVLKKNINFEQ